MKGHCFSRYKLFLYASATLDLEFYLSNISFISSYIYLSFINYSSTAWRIAMPRQSLLKHSPCKFSLYCISRRKKASGRTWMSVWTWTLSDSPCSSINHVNYLFERPQVHTNYFPQNPALCVLMWSQRSQSAHMEGLLENLDISVWCKFIRDPI